MQRLSNAPELLLEGVEGSIQGFSKFWALPTSTHPC